MLSLLAPRVDAKPLPVEAFLYTTMPCYSIHRPEMAMDGDTKTSFRSAYGMEEGDSFTVILNRPIPIRSIRISTGSGGEDILTDAYFEVSTDGTTYTKAADFDAKGVAEATSFKGQVTALRIRMNPHKSATHLQIGEIAIDSPQPVTHAQMGPSRGFVDVSRAPDLAGWAAKAEKQMESFWPDTAALLYSDGFITPNAVNVIYMSGPDVTPVAATGGGVMTVNVAYARAHPNDSGLTVHETAHVVQSGGSPGWLIEAVADYIRWIKYEPQNFTYNINLRTATMHDPYRSGAAFLGWCELHYDEKLVTKLNDAARFGRYNDGLFEKYCGKPIDVLYKEFIAAYKADKAHLLEKPLPLGMRPHPLPDVTGASTRVDMDYNVAATTPDNAKFNPNGGFDEGGAAFSGTLLNGSVTTKGVTFRVGPASGPNALVAHGQTINLSGAHKSVWLLAAAVDGGQREQSVVIEYQDGSRATVVQNFSDWFEPEDFPGEVRALRMPYRNLANGSRDPRPFYVYAYGLPLDSGKPVKSITLPNNPNIRVLAISLAD